ncbi:MAG TPA: FkbM family methyltransferase [Candidatus Omnitrophota bacterium]|nr:FkbM family methyltransferase [Candidatus Omnitrophota bacterium]
MADIKTIRRKLILGCETVLDARTLKVGGSWNGWNFWGLFKQVYDPRSLEFFYGQTKRFASPVMLDIGASTGSFCLLPLLNQELTCYAFEPIPSIFEILSNNVRLNRLADSVKIYNLALWHREGTARLKVPVKKSCSGLSCLGGNPKRFREYEEIEVKTTTLDRFFSESGIRKVDLIKIDTEGCEKYVLLGGEKTIKTFLPDLYLELSIANMSQFNYAPEDLYALLASWGYQPCSELQGEDQLFRHLSKIENGLSEKK